MTDIPAANSYGEVSSQLCLVSADSRLLHLQEECGGVAGGPLAVPELRMLVEKAVTYGITLFRSFEVLTDKHKIEAWGRISPAIKQGGGCAITITDWIEVPISANAKTVTREEHLKVHKALAACIVILDKDYRVLAVEASERDLAQIAQRNFRSGELAFHNLCGRDGEAYDPAFEPAKIFACQLKGSQRKWQAFAEPTGATGQQPAGFKVYLTAQAVLPPNPTAHSDAARPSLGRDLTPALQQPINRIIANAETIRSRLAGPIRQEYSEYAKDIASAGQHLSALIDDLADLEVVESADFSTAPDQIDLADVARRACGILGVRAAERKIQLEAPVETQEVLATAEFRRVLQVLINLIANAIRYSEQHTTVQVSVHRADSRAMVTVADQGPGLSDDDQVKIFDKFERLGRGDDGGSGLGLYISRRIARAMDGDLTIESAPGQGARFTLTVPVSQNKE